MLRHSHPHLSHSEAFIVPQKQLGFCGTAVKYPATNRFWALEFVTMSLTTSVHTYWIANGYYYSLGPNVM